MTEQGKYTGLEIAIVGIACRLPGAANWREYWHNLVNGIESIRFEPDGGLPASDTDRDSLEKKNFVNAKASISGKDFFDSSFFNFTDSEARLLNPVHRIFHECVWEALEDAGYDPEHTEGLIGLYAGSGDDLNWRDYARLSASQEDTDSFTLHLINNKDYLTSLISYKLNLRGPSYSINTACSTSLVSVNLACKSLLFGETKMALAGGISVFTQKTGGYFYEEGMIGSPDGHCRAFDKDAGGTVMGEGAGVVVLKRLEDAIREGDQIYAVIKGCAVNNDGNRKVGFSAPSVEGQAECIRKALKLAKVEPPTIRYIEAHGTGTRLGDPIEVRALNIVFAGNEEKNSCALGSVKTNIGHADAAAGVAGLIKTALSLKYKKIPASLHFVEPNPTIDFAGGPFYINTTLREWPSAGNFPRRAGVSSFGIGGSNAHAVLEEAPEAMRGDPGRRFKIAPLSARTERALTERLKDLKRLLLEEPAMDLADMAYTLQVGRKHHPFRHCLVFRDREELLSLLDSGNLKIPARGNESRKKKIVFLFPGQGTQYVQMGRDLYAEEPVFKKEMDTGFSLLEELTGESYRLVLFPEEGTSARIDETCYAQPLLFLVEYSLARLLNAIGISPQYMIGHSVGEYVAACLAGVFSFKDALRLLVKRGELMNLLPRGEMLSAALTAQEANAFLNREVSLAADNAPRQVVFSGNPEAIKDLTDKLDQASIPFIRLKTSHAFHSSMQDEILDAFKSELQKVTLSKPILPFISNVTGKLMEDDQAIDPDYWVAHLRQTVKFSEGLQTLLYRDPALIAIEVGPGSTLTGLLKQQKGKGPLPFALTILRSSNEKPGDPAYWTACLAQLWSQGIDIDWLSFYKAEKRKRVSLPTYPFEPLRYITEVNPFAGQPPVTTAYLASNTGLPATMREFDADGQTTGRIPSVAITRSGRPDTGALYAAASTDTEKQLKEIFENFFEMDDIGIDDSFLALGGDSLKGLVLLARIKNKFSLNLSLKDFFESQTIRKIAAGIDELNLLLGRDNKLSRKTIRI